MNRREATAGRFFTLVLVLSLPLWVADRLLGDRRLPDPMQLPISALMFAVPPLAAWLNDRRRPFHPRSSLLGQERLWIVPAVAAFPAIGAVTGVVTGTGWDPAGFPARLGFYLIPALSEEVAWMGHAFPRLGGRRRPMAAAFLIGVFSALWHLVPDLMAGREPGWIVAHRLGSVGGRILIAWLYVISGNGLGVATAAHAADNAVVSLFPGDAYRPGVYGPVTLAVALLAVAIRRLKAPDTTADATNG